MAKYDDLMVFADDSVSSESTDIEQMNRVSQGVWKILIVDDDEGIHQITRLVLRDFLFMDKSLEILSAYNKEGAIKTLSEHPDIALVLLDVVMDEEDTGLQLIKHIREVQKNRLIRIILRTGQPGQAPERQVIVEYDINDYKLKTELTADKLFVSVVTALRSFSDLYHLDHSSNQLRRIIGHSGDLFSERKVESFISKALEQFDSTFERRASHLAPVSGFIANKINNRFLVVTGFGRFIDHTGEDVQTLLSFQAYKDLINTSDEGSSLEEKRYIVGFDIENVNHVFYMDSTAPLNIWDCNLVDIYIGNIKSAYRNLDLIMEIEQTQQEMIFTLGEVAEARSNEMGNHVRRVSEYSRLLAKKIGFSDEEADLLALASPVHDVGKLAIPDEILNKPGSLTKEEFEIMKTHASIGYDMLKNSQRDLMHTAAIIAVSHHEKWNGKGYPKGTSGTETHTYGRIVALVDVFDALDSDRVYKKAWPMDKIIQLIKDERGEHFDPTITDAFLDNIDEFLAVRQLLKQ